MNEGVERIPTHWLALAEEEFVPSDAGGRVESANILRAATAAGIRLHVIVPGMVSAESIARHQAALPETSIEGIPRRTGALANASLAPYLFASRPMPADLVGRMRQLHLLDPFDAVLAVSFRVVHLGRGLSAELGIPLLVRPHNVESEYFEQLAASSAFPRNIAYRVEAWKLRRAEREVHASSDVGLYADIGERDSAWRAQQTATPVIHVPPFVGPTTAGIAAPAPGSRDGLTVLFLGALDNPNNLGGVRWFVECCWPSLRREVPGIELHVVGRRAPAELIAELEAVGVRVTVDAPSVAGHLAAADVFVNPVQQGAGVNIKMIEAMNAGLAVVSSPTGARGMPWLDGEQLLIADGSTSFAAAVAQLIRDPQERARLAVAGRQFVRDELDGVRQITRMRDSLESPSTPR